MRDRARMNQLVSAENKDRKALYQAIADANNQPGWAGQIQKTFAERWISQAQSGWWYQSGGGWKKKINRSAAIGCASAHLSQNRDNNKYPNTARYPPLPQDVQRPQRGRVGVGVTTTFTMEARFLYCYHLHISSAN